MKIDWYDEQHDLRLRETADGSILAEVLLESKWHYWGVVTVGELLKSKGLKDGEFGVRIRSEGEWLKQLLAAGVFEDTSRTVTSGFATVPIWRRGPQYDEVAERLH